MRTEGIIEKLDGDSAYAAMALDRLADILY